MIHRTATMPAARSLGQLRTLTANRWPNLLSVNTIDGDDGTPAVFLAVYFDGPAPSDAEVTAWRADVAAHVPQSPTPEEQHAATAVNADTIRSQAFAAFTANRAHLALASPTNAQNSAQVKALTRQVNGILRVIYGVLDGTD